eukprot:5466937-Pleurochrysis_carterae.AAC.1
MSSFTTNFAYQCRVCGRCVNGRGRGERTPLDVREQLTALGLEEVVGEGHRRGPLVRRALVHLA